MAILQNKLELFTGLALGELIDATQRETFPPNPDAEYEPDMWNKSGSIGFMDIRRKIQSVPKEGAKPHPNEEHQYDDHEEIEALTINKIGIEPEYQGKGHARFLKQRVEEIALEWGLDTIVSDMIINPLMRDYNARLGYILYDGGRMAVKRLKQ